MAVDFTINFTVVVCLQKSSIAGWGGRGEEMGRGGGEVLVGGGAY